MIIRRGNDSRKKRSLRVRGRFFGTVKKPRLSVFRSGKHIYAQLIDDEKGVTLASTSDSSFKEGTKIERASKVGENLAEEARKKKIKTVVFDRGGYAYHGRVAAVADGARKGGLEF